MTYEIWWVGCMNIYGRFLLRSVVLILVFRFLLRLSFFMLRVFDRFCVCCVHFSLTSKCLCAAVFLRPFLEGTVEDFSLERVYCTLFLFQALGGLIVLFPLCSFLFFFLTCLFSGGLVCKFHMGHDSDMSPRR